MLQQSCLLLLVAHWQKGHLLGLQVASWLFGILLEAAGADNDVRSVEVLGPEALIRIHCTSAPQAGLRYDVKSDGLELDQADTTKYKLEVLEYDSVSAYAICRIVNYAQIAA